MKLISLLQPTTTLQLYLTLETSNIFFILKVTVETLYIDHDTPNELDFEKKKRLKTKAKLATLKAYVHSGLLILYNKFALFIASLETFIRFGKL